jgi:hypothetical protein
LSDSVYTRCTYGDLGDRIPQVRHEFPARGVERVRRVREDGEVVAIGLGMTFFVDELAGERMERLVLGKAFRVQAHGRQELASISVEQQARSAEGWKTWMRSRTIAWESSLFLYEPRRTSGTSEEDAGDVLVLVHSENFIPTVLPPGIAAPEVSPDRPPGRQDSGYAL